MEKALAKAYRWALIREWGPGTVERISLNIALPFLSILAMAIIELSEVEIAAEGAIRTYFEGNWTLKVSSPSLTISFRCCNGLIFACLEIRRPFISMVELVEEG